MLAALCLSLSAVPAALANDPALWDELQALAPLRAMRVTDPDSGGPPALSDDEYRRVLGGELITGMEPVPGYTAKKIYGAALLEGPISRLWASVNSELQHREWTAVEYSEIVGGRACGSPREVFHYLPIPLGPDRWWITHLEINDRLLGASDGAMRELTWRDAIDPHKVKTPRGQELVAEITPLAFTRGSWFLVSLGPDRTLVEYYAWVDPGGVIPAGPASSFAMRSVAENFHAMEKFAREGQPACLDQLADR